MSDSRKPPNPYIGFSSEAPTNIPTIQTDYTQGTGISQITLPLEQDQLYVNPSPVTAFPYNESTVIEYPSSEVSRQNQVYLSQINHQQQGSPLQPQSTLMDSGSFSGLSILCYTCDKWDRSDFPVPTGFPYFDQLSPTEKTSNRKKIPSTNPSWISRNIGLYYHRFFSDVSIYRNILRESK